MPTAAVIIDNGTTAVALHTTEDSTSVLRFKSLLCYALITKAFDYGNRFMVIIDVVERKKSTRVDLRFYSTHGKGYFLGLGFP